METYGTLKPPAPARPISGQTIEENKARGTTSHQPVVPNKIVTTRSASKWSNAKPTLKMAMPCNAHLAGSLNIQSFSYVLVGIPSVNQFVHCQIWTCENRVTNKKCWLPIWRCLPFTQLPPTKPEEPKQPLSIVTQPEPPRWPVSIVDPGNGERKICFWMVGLPVWNEGFHKLRYPKMDGYSGKSC